MSNKELVLRSIKQSAFGRKSLTAIERDSGLCKATVCNRLSELIKEKLVDKEKVSGVTVYKLL